MKRFANLVAAAIALTLLFASACRDDIVLEPLPTLEGTYDGLFIVITKYQTPLEETTSSVVELRFSEESYWFDSHNNPDDFCSPRGEYILSNTIELSETQKNCAGVTADESDNPRGLFSIRRPADSIIMLQLIDSTSTLKQLLLQKR